MDMTESIAPRSDQLNADDLMAGPVTVTIQEVSKGSAEQPVNVHLVEFLGRAYRPSKSMRRVMVAAWGKYTTEYAGRGLTLFRNPDITFGRDKVGGIEISHLSHIDKPMTVALTATRGKRKQFTVQPLKTAPEPAPTAAASTERNWYNEAMALGGDQDKLKDLFMDAQASGASQQIIDGIGGMLAPVEQ